MTAPRWDFYWAVADPVTTPWPPATLPEIAFVGRSNVGKSSLINTLTRTKSLARTSKSPGQTQQINFYRREQSLILADLPGYGYAKVSHTLRERWRHLMQTYLEERSSLAHVYVLLDSRRGLGPQDILAIQMLNHLERPYSLVLTKLDKLTLPQQQALPNTLKASYTAVFASPEPPQLYPWSLNKASSHQLLIKAVQRHTLR